MTSYIVETYVARDAASPDGAVDRARLLAASLAAAVGRVRLVRSYVVPDDEQCFHVVEAESADEVIRAAAQAGVEVERIVEAVDLDGESRRPPG